jgi:hypothetical protein
MELFFPYFNLHFLFSGKDNVEVRKRILNRELDQRRGKLFLSFGGEMAEMLESINKALAATKEPTDAYFQHLKVQPFHYDCILLITFYFYLGSFAHDSRRDGCKVR